MTWSNIFTVNRTNPLTGLSQSNIEDISHFKFKQQNKQFKHRSPPTKFMPSVYGRFQSLCQLPIFCKICEPWNIITLWFPKDRKYKNCLSFISAIYDKTVIIAYWDPYIRLFTSFSSFFPIIITSSHFCEERIKYIWNLLSVKVRVLHFLGWSRNLTLSKSWKRMAWVIRCTNQKFLFSMHMKLAFSRLHYL